MVSINSQFSSAVYHPLYTYTFIVMQKADAECAAGIDASKCTPWQYYDSIGDDGLILNLDNTILCSGTAVAWHFNYFVDYDEIDLRSEFRVYRAVENGAEGMYQVISGSSMPIHILESELVEDDAVCKCLVIMQPFEVKEGDIIGVCFEHGLGTPRMLATAVNKRVHLGPASTRDCSGINTINLQQWSNVLDGRELLLELEIS